MGTLVRFTLNDGQVLDVDPSAPWTLREQIEWERHFKQSFSTVHRAISAEMAAAEQDDLVVSAHYRVEWMLWFGWYRLRGKVAGSFDRFLDQAADYDFIIEPEPAPPAPAEAGGAPDPTDPTPEPDDGSLSPTP